MRLLRHFLLFGFLLTLAGTAVVGLGLYDISATDQHLRPTYRLLRTAMERSVERRAKDIAAPHLDAPAQIERGFVLFREHCVQCHGAPGVAPEPFAMALRPLATPLARSGRERSPQFIYWVVKHGIKMTGMPAWEFRFAEADLWSVVAFVKHLPSLSPSQYGRLTGATFEREEERREPDAKRGKRALEQYACVTCHEIPGIIGPEARLGPTLHGIGGRGTIGGVLENTPENMAAWIRSPRAYSANTAMPAMGVSARDARDMAAFLASQR
ncbi:MAG TPA: c-type cytochrome [Usitatibacter sp.]|nr:c-type cytochrome [Usitatibacter sp.]